MKNIFSKFKKTEEQSPNDYLIVGLGNPGDEYKETRHNIGFMVIDNLIKDMKVNYASIKHQAMLYKVKSQGKTLYFAKPQNFMNRSGQSVKPLLKEFNIPIGNLLIIFDDADLPYETLRLRPTGGSSGQKGMKSIIEKLGTQDFSRIRMGIDRPPGKMSTPNFVLKKFSRTQQEALPFVLNRASDAVNTFIRSGIEIAMNEHNRSE